MKKTMLEERKQLGKGIRFKIKSLACLWGNQIGSVVGNETGNVNWDYIVKGYQCQAKELG